MSKIAVNTTVPKVMLAAGIKASDFPRVEHNERYIMERKLDGFRLVTVIRNPPISDWDEYMDGASPSAEGYSRARKGQLLADRLPDIHDFLCDTQGIDVTNGYTILDGELSTDDDDFLHVAGVMKSLPARARILTMQKPLVYKVFDLLALNGYDTRGLKLGARRELLEQLFVTESDLDGGSQHPVVLTEQSAVDQQTILEWQSAGGEGAIIKDIEGLYVSGKRPVRNWMKVKATIEADVIITGYTEGRGKYKGQIGAVKYGQIKDGVLKTRGQCSGMTDAERLEFSNNQLANMGRVMVIRHMGVQRDGFRHPQFRYLRSDKPAEECTWD